MAFESIHAIAYLQLVSTSARVVGTDSLFEEIVWKIG